MVMLPIILLTFLVYTFIWITICVKNGNMDRKLMRSLTWTMLMILCGYFLIAVTLVHDTFKENIETEDLLKHHIYAGLAINATIAMNYPIYYFNNHDYKTAFNEQLKIIFCCPTSNSIQSQISSIEMKA
jgi:hypothetical protein